MLENEGHWLKLMRNANIPVDANICLCISGGEILCTVTKDVNKEVELKVTCRIAEDHNRLCEDTSIDDSEGMFTFDSSLSEEMLSNKQESSPVGKSENDNTCDSEVGNISNQEVGVTQVDERKRSCDLEEINSKRRRVSITSARKLLVEESSIYKCPLCSFLIEDARIFEKHFQSHRSPSFKRASSHIANAQSFCDACNIQFMSVDTYEVHKKFYCKSRHDKEDHRISSPVSAHTTLTIPGAFKPSADTVILRNGTLNGTGATPSLIQPQAIYAAISTNPLILLPCSIVSGESLVAQNTVIAPAGTGIVLQTPYPAMVGKQPPVSTKEEMLPNRKTSHPAMNFSSGSPEEISKNSTLLRKRKMSEGDVLNLKKPVKLSDSEEETPMSSTNVPDAPLDLSFKKRNASEIPYKRPIEAVDSKECSPIPSGESCSGVFSSVRIIKSPSDSDSIHCYSSHEAVPLLKQSDMEKFSPSSPLLQTENKSSILPPGMPPPKVLKQGNNVCEECNIVFYKYDNYLAHKKHYCAYRRQQLSVLAAAAAANVAPSSSGSCHEHSSDENNSNHSTLHETARAYSADEISNSILKGIDNSEPFHISIKKPLHSAYICDACGVKFSSLDTLNAHQTYYCSKREDSVMSKYVKSRSDGSTLEPPFSGPEEWKCNYCETTCSSYETIRRHLLTHSELRGFRCLICGYKGNTLRGMRTHAGEHLSESTTSIEEFMSSTVISENDALPVTRHDAELSDENSEASKYSPKRKRNFSEGSRDDCQAEAELSECGEMSASKRTPSQTHFQELDSSCVKVETRSNSEDRHFESVNPLAFCDVVIKTENEQTSSGDESRDWHVKTSIKSEPEPDSDCDNNTRESPQPISVIRCAPDKGQRDNNSEKLSDSQTKSTEMKYCKSCGISFYHMSNFVAHKKFYCSHPVPNCIQETTTVQ